MVVVVVVVPWIVENLGLCEVYVCPSSDTILENVKLGALIELP